MDEKLRRLWAASEAVALGKGGIKTVAFATGLSCNTIRTGIKELQIPFKSNNPVKLGMKTTPKVRKPGGGRKKVTETADTKKKELIGNYKNNGSEWQRTGEPVKVKVHDLTDPDKGKIIPYGVYDLTENSGWVNVGISHDTAEFAVSSIRQWWLNMGQKLYPEATEILLTADCGGSNGYRIRLWKTELQKLATETGLQIRVAHLPPGTSKWNKIEHRMFCHITENWRSRPLLSREVAINLISNTSTNKGLKLKASLDEAEYPMGKKISDRDFLQVNLKKDNFHGEWNYSILPKLIDK